MKKLLLYNDFSYHYEIIESLILNYRNIFNISNNEKVQIFLHIKPNNSFKKYITSKYPDIILFNTKTYDYYINCTIYDRHYNSLIKTNSPNKKYIAHEITERLEKNPNVYFLTPLAKQYLTTNILPFSDKKIKSDVPIYAIQGHLHNGRRNMSLLTKILKNTYNHNFMIKLIGRGNLPKSLEPYKNKIILKNNLDFIDFHKEFLDVYCIIPLISKKSHPQYYTYKLTSTINYATGYKLKCLIDIDLQNIYQLNNVEIYNNESDIVDAFTKTLDDFYR
jgi:hypothetical protein